MDIVIGNVEDSAVGFSKLSDAFDCSLVVNGSLCEICGKLVSDNTISVSGALSLGVTTPYLIRNLDSIQYSVLYYGYQVSMHFAPSRRFLTKTDCPISNSQCLLCASW